MSTTGPTGPQGLLGIRGAQGVTGADGPTGLQGSQGKQGIQGITGPSGSQGLLGIRGIQGLTGAGGPTGLQGSQGKQGIQGVTGPSGSYGLMGLRGNTGPTGIQGKQGNQGTTGKQGIQGVTGKQGIQGVTGSKGIPGPAFGYTGPDGSILVYSGTNVTGTTGFSFFPGTGMMIEGNIIPRENLIYSLGASGAAWNSLHVGETIHMVGPGDVVGTIGTDQHGMVYTQSGFATPFINVGPTLNVLDPSDIGGWVIGPTGMYGDSNYDLVTQQKTQGVPVPEGLTGQVFSLTRPLGNVIATADWNGITTRDSSKNLEFGSKGDAAAIVSHRPIILQDENDNVIVQITSDRDGNGSITFGGGSNSISMNNGLSISNITHLNDNADIQPLSYHTNGKVTYGQLNYAHFLGFPRLPNYESNAAANVAISTDPFFTTPQMGQMYFNTVSKKAMIYDGSQWNTIG